GRLEPRPQTGRSHRHRGAAGRRTAGPPPTGPALRRVRGRMVAEAPAGGDPGLLRIVARRPAAPADHAAMNMAAGTRLLRNTPAACGGAPTPPRPAVVHVVGD